MENKAYKKYMYRALSLGVVLGIWKLLSVHFSPMVVPTMGSVLAGLLNIFSSSALYHMIGLTILRLLIGLSIGVFAGLVIGVLMGRFTAFHEMMSPIIGLLQTVPPVSWVVLALVWFGFNGRPAIFIVVISSLPIIAINILEGIQNVDHRLLQMAELYQFPWKKKMRHVVLPSIAPYFRSAFKITLGVGWKIAVMGEVLTTNDGIGGMIKQARINVEPEYIIAWSLIIVLLFYVSDFFLSRVLFRREADPCSK